MCRIVEIQFLDTGSIIGVEVGDAPTDSFRTKFIEHLSPNNDISVVKADHLEAILNYWQEKGNYTSDQILVPENYIKRGKHD